MRAQTFVMIITENPGLERMTFSLLHASGCAPVLPAADEGTLNAIRRVRPGAVIVDCEHPAAVSDRFFELVSEYGIGVLIYGRETREADVELIARQQNVCKLSLPMEGTVLADKVLGAMQM